MENCGGTIWKFEIGSNLISRYFCTAIFILIPGIRFPKIYPKYYGILKLINVISIGGRIFILIHRIGNISVINLYMKGILKLI